MKDRKKMMIMKTKIFFVILEIKNIFAKSQNISVSKGKVSFFIRNNHQDRKRKYPNEEMKVDDSKQNIIEDFNLKIAFLKEKKINTAKEKMKYLMTERIF